MGREPHVFKSHTVARGMMAVGTPEFRFPKVIVRYEIACFAEMRVTIHLNSLIRGKTELTKRGVST